MPEPHGRSAEPILVVDFGTHASSAAIVVADHLRLVADPVSGSPRWPSAVCHDGAGLLVGAAAEERRDTMPDRYIAAVRRAVDSDTKVWLGDRQFTGAELISATLSTMTAVAERDHGGRIGRLALTVPPGYQLPDQRREVLISVAAAAGFPDAELVSDSVAAALDPDVGLALPNGSLVLVCDLGATWTVALLQVGDGHAVPLAQETSGAGRDFDLLLLQDLRVTLPETVEPLLARGGDAGMRAYYQVTDLVRRVKHRLSEVAEVTEQLPGADRPYHLTRVELERFAEPSLRWLLASCRAVVAKGRASLGDVAAVVLAGGSSRLPVARMMIQAGLGRPVWQAARPELAAVRGAARWAVRASRRGLPPERPKWRVEPLSWKIPNGQARIVRWLVEEGEPYPAGALLAQVRTPDDRVYDLTANREGTLLEHRLRAGAVVASAAVAATTRCATLLAGGDLTRRHCFKSSVNWLLTPDRRLVIEWPEHGGYARARDITAGSVVAEVRPAYGDAAALGGRVFTGPDGRPAFVSWAGDGRFTVFDLLAGATVARFKAPYPPALVLVDEAKGRLVVESAKRMRVGRYQRDTATVWDLRTGGLVEELVGEDLHRRYAGFAARTAADAFAADAVSPDGRLHATTVADGTEVCVLEVETGQEAFRAGGADECVDGDIVRAVRVAFSADGRHLLAHWRSTVGGWVDVWDVVSRAT